MLISTRVVAILFFAYVGLCNEISQDMAGKKLQSDLEQKQTLPEKKNT
jgi:hypothetical protein